jgi:hypothetical protein
MELKNINSTAHPDETDRLESFVSGLKDQLVKPQSTSTGGTYLKSG